MEQLMKNCNGKDLRKYQKKNLEGPTKAQKYKIENVLKNEFIVKQVKKLQPFQVGQQVMAIHPICGHFHIGQVLTTNGDCCIVKFNTNDLGVHKISENKISIELVQQKEQNINENQSSEQNIGVQNILNSSSISLPQNQGLQLFNSAKNPNSQLNKNVLNGQIFQKPLQTQMPQDSQMQQMYEMIKDIDLQGMAFLIKILDRKLMLINYLKEFNNYIEQNPNNITEQFTQDYGWTGVQINLLDEALKDIIIKFRLRGLQNYGNTQKVEQNLNKLMMGPLKQMQDQMKNSKTAQDQKLYQQIKSQNQRVFEESIQQSIQKLLQNVESDIIQEKNKMFDIELQKQKQQATNQNSNEMEQEYKIKDIKNQKQQLNDQFNSQVDGINKLQNKNIENCDIDQVISEDQQINNSIPIQNQINQKNDEPEIQIKQQYNQKQKDKQNNVQQSDNNSDNELDKKIEELESNQIKHSDSNIKKIRKNILKHVDWSEQEDTNIYDDLRDLIGNSMGVLYSLNSQQQKNNQFDISQNIYYKNMSQHIYSDFNQHYFKIQNTISNISSKTM
ncbi:hypothetical protein PPERSA_03285 [Pseudocohnilembus persalinus]|uniref:Uncharacterized protein n=1 Tax=Pseudocohnilembus persalinus TaxID=266149 RepID=A0A0V0Q8D7_PSEPJ|nr:hypothetical protein PPERSA_03285 [Pseudocohnilembus persalinus]|eukprot:KRW98454.1 hypothetical protein PPERSA_03285 [Pseudocohnilembus persalinus]